MLASATSGSKGAGATDVGIARVSTGAVFGATVTSVGTEAVSSTELDTVFATVSGTVSMVGGLATLLEHAAPAKTAHATATANLILIIDPPRPSSPSHNPNQPPTPSAASARTASTECPMRASGKYGSSQLNRKAVPSMRDACSPADNATPTGAARSHSYWPPECT